ncbi:MAG: hypothetical protein ACJAS9_003946 [Polaribacter sp.]|jgi:hypothetical protein
MSFKLFPSNHERTILITIASFCIGMVIGLLPGLDTKTIAGAVATLVAAFSGAYFAYKFNADREVKRKEEIDLASANKAIFTLIRAYNYIAGFNKQFIQPYKDSPEAYVAIRPSLGNSNPDLKLNYDSIYFLISERKSEILTELTEFEELFIIFIDAVKTRNHIHLNSVQPAMEDAGFIQGNPVTLGEIDGVLGDRTSSIMKRLTTELIDMAQRGEEQSEELIKKLHNIMVEIFPGKNVVKMQKLNKQNHADV